MRRSPGAPDRLRDSIAEVVEGGLCTGCGVCELISPRVTMTAQHDYMRPVVEGHPTRDDRVEARTFQRSCPGRSLVAPRPSGSTRDDFLGPLQGAWRAWAVDPAFRHRGSSGGTLTALAAFLASKDRTVSGVAGSSEAPRRTVPVSITSRDEALRAAGSRYAPVSAGGRATTGADVVVGKPCEAAGRRQLDESLDRESPVLLSFFCAGTPSQQATESLLEGLGVPQDETLTDLWYRGRGWPGRFTAVRRTGDQVSVDYSTSWGGALGPTVQWRCRLCVDGVGEFADVVAGDFWEADEQGYPDFTEGRGVSALLARTERGVKIVQEAAAEGWIHLEPLDIEALLHVQPYQVQRRKYMIGRLVGNRLTGGINPSYRGFRLWYLTRKSPRRLWHEVRGTVRRAGKRG